MKSFLYKRWHIITFFVLSLAPFFWLPKNSVIYGPDTMWSANGSDTFSTLIPTWKNNNGFGYGWSDSGRVIHNFLITILRHAHFSYANSQKIILFLLIFSSAYFTYLFARQIFRANSTRNKVYGCIASFIFVLNPFAITWIWWRFLGVMYAYPCWPLLFYVATRVINQNISKLQLILFALLFSLFAPGVSAPILLLTLYAGVSIYFVLRLYFDQKGHKTRSVANLIFFSLVYFLINAYWLLPGILLLNHSISSALTAYDPNAAFKFNSQYSTLYNTIRLWGASALHISFFGQSYFGTGVTRLLSNNIVQILLLVPFVGAVIALFNQNRLSSLEKRACLSFLVLISIGVFMMKAGSAPFGFVNKETLNLPLGAAFRIPYDKFGYFVAIGYALLVPLGLKSLKGKVARSVYIVFLSAYLAIPLAIFFVPHVLLDNDKSTLKGVVAQVPTEYSQLSKLGLKTSNRILILPTAYNGESSFNWPKGAQTNSHDILSDYVPSQIVFLPNGNNYSDQTKANLTTELFSGMYDGKTIESVLKNYGIDHLFVHKDWNAGFMLNKEPLPQHYIELVKQLPDTKLVKQNKYYDLYSLSKSNLTEVTATNKVKSAKTSFSNQLSTAASVTNIYGQNSVYRSATVKDQNEILNLGTPSIKGNSLTYAFNIRKATNSFYINTKTFANIPGAEILIDGKGIDIEGKISLNNEKLINTNLNPGKHELSIINLPVINFYDQNLSTIKDDLSIDWECGKKFKDNISQGYDFSTALNFFSLISTPQYASCHMLYVTNIKPDKNALISFRYKTRYQTGARLIVYEDDQNRGRGNTSQVVNQELESSSKWITYTTNFHTQAGKEYRPIFYSGLNDGINSETSYEDLQGVSVPAGFSQMLTYVDGYQQASSSSAPKISARNSYEDNTLYSVNVTSTTKYVLNDNHSYDPYWRVYVASSSWKPNLLDKIFGPIGLTKVSSNDHFVINGYSNGWQLPATNGTAKIVFEYWPQRLFNLGLTITAGTMFAMVSYIAIKKWKK